jgi:hypothetical protein
VDNDSAGVNCDFSNATTITQAGNLSDDDSCSGFDVTGAATLMPLADNGGPTWTHALPDDSPAIGAGSPTYCLLYDQRGILRGKVCDVGAYEYGEASLIFLPVVIK